MMVRERRNWTAEEDALLKNAVELARSSDSQSLSWNTVALGVPGRTNKDCRKRFHYKISSTVSRGAWTRTEDERLRGAIQKHGLKWSRVAVDVGTRNGDQCSKRWKNTIDPRIDRSAWTSQDDQLLIQSVERMGHNWKAIVESLFPGRTALQARNQYNLICRRTGINTQLSTPSSMQGLATPLPTEGPLPHLKPSDTEFARPYSQRLPKDTDFEYEESNSCSDEDDDDNDNTGWPQDKEWSQWDPASALGHMQEYQSPSYYNTVTSHDMETLAGPLPDDGMGFLTSFDLNSPGQLGFGPRDLENLQQASNQSFIGDQMFSHNFMTKPLS